MATQAHQIPLEFHVASKEVCKLPDGSSPLATLFLDDISFNVGRDTYTLCNLIMLTDKTEFTVDESCRPLCRSNNGKTIYVRVAQNKKDHHIIGIEHTVAGIDLDESMDSLMEFISMHIAHLYESLDAVVMKSNRMATPANDPFINYTLSML